MDHYDRQPSRLLPDEIASFRCSNRFFELLITAAKSSGVKLKGCEELLVLAVRLLEFRRFLLQQWKQNLERCFRIAATLVNSGKELLELWPLWGILTKQTTTRLSHQVLWLRGSRPRGRLPEKDSRLKVAKTCEHESHLSTNNFPSNSVTAFRKCGIADLNLPRLKLARPRSCCIRSEITLPSYIRLSLSIHI